MWDRVVDGVTSGPHGLFCQVIGALIEEFLRRLPPPRTGGSAFRPLDGTMAKIPCSKHEKRKRALEMLSQGKGALVPSRPFFLVSTMG